METLWQDLLRGPRMLAKILVSRPWPYGRWLGRRASKLYPGTPGNEGRPSDRFTLRMRTDRVDAAFHRC
jgi:hypothetical protein